MTKLGKDKYIEFGILIGISKIVYLGLYQVFNEIPESLIRFKTNLKQHDFGHGDVKSEKFSTNLHL